MRDHLLQRFAVVCLTALAITALPALASPPTSSELICHSSNPAECYPRIFQATEDFQLVHEDQDLPAGLHVRLNINTGLKEARLNTPLENEEVGQAVVVVPDTVDEIPEASSTSESSSRKAPSYEAAGKIMPPRDAEESGDASHFHRAIDVLRANSQPSDDDISSALADLLDLSHDIFYGVELMKQNEVLQTLVDMMAEEGSVEQSASRRRRQAASILGNSIQNNPTALKEFQGSWKDLVQPVCGERLASARDGCEDGLLVDNIMKGLKNEHDPSAMKAKIGTFSGLSKARGIRNDFLEKNGMESLLSIYLKDGEQWDGTRVKIAQFVMDTFLDADMGADLDSWPTQAAIDSSVCTRQGNKLADGCWEHHLERMHEQRPSDEDNSVGLNFLRLLKERRGRPSVGKSPVDREL